MATAKEFRASVLAAAAHGLNSNPNDDSGMRARLFAAYLDGCFRQLGEPVMAAALDRLLGLDAPKPPTDGA